MDSQFFGMMTEDKSAVANLPQSVVYKPFPKTTYITSELDDTMKQLDSTRSADMSNVKRNKSQVKY